MAELSPMMQQYLNIKEQNKDSILFFRLGDFYEMFFEDAKLVSQELDLVLTGRDCGQEERAPMCGVPYHSCESYIARLIAKGYKVAICEQTEDPKAAKGLVKREVTNIITPGTVIEESMLDESRNNYLCSIAFLDGVCGICFVDASTGDVKLTDFSGDGIEQRIIAELGRFWPREIIYDSSMALHGEVNSFLENHLVAATTQRPKEDFSESKAKNIILTHFGITSLDELGLRDNSALTASLGAALVYLYETRKSGLDGINSINIYSDSQYMRLDISAIRNLELCETMRGKDKRGSLLWVLDKTKTSMGRRYLRGLIEQPLLSVNEINSRYNAVEELVSDTVKRGEIRELLSGVRDLERLMSRIVYGTASPRELKTLSFTINFLPTVKALLQNSESRLLKEIFGNIDVMTDIAERIDNTLVDDPPASSRDGEIIRDGFSKEVDELKDSLENGKDYLAAIENGERERTGIKTLKVRYNKVFGYYIEVTNSYKDMVPTDYIRKQTLTNCERFITEELKTLESKILGANERIVRLEFEIYDELRRWIADRFRRIQVTASAISKLDAFASLAEVAAKNNYCRPTLNTEGKITIINGRHPVVELINKNPFVPNDAVLDLNDNRCAIITGPNMAGKSTYMRQIALVTVMAQIGSFVPAQSADIGIVDAVFTRVGASDDLASGKSTFMVEMSEVAYILKNATSKSLLILDEIGRGTSTFDGMSIARAVLEYVSDKKKLGSKTLFATHYHELTEMEGKISGVKNYNIAVKKRGDDITFLRRIIRGGADGSYGIEVAKLSGIPDSVTARAKKILSELESQQPVQKAVISEPEVAQISFSSENERMLIEELKILDANTLTPIEAMNKLFEIVDRAKNI